MTLLDDHRHLGAATVAVTAISAGLLGIVLLMTGHARAVPGLLAGAAVGGVDALLLVRGLSRFGRSHASLPSRALAGALMSRFLSVGILLGLIMATRRLDPIGALCGFLLFPASIVLVGATAVRRDRQRRGQHASR